MLTEFTNRLVLSLRRNGIGHTVRAAGRHLTTWVSTMADRRFDRRYRVDTGDFVEIHDMADVESPNLERGIRYEPTRARPLRRILREVAFPPESVFVDFGCGKGRAMLLAAERGFRRVVGVDFSPNLCEIARANLGAYQRRSGLQFDAMVHRSDAVDFPIQPEYNVMFFYNPFDADILEKVVAAIDKSLRDHPRKMWMIYHNPLWRHTVESHGFAPVIQRCYGGCEFVVYTRDADGAS